MDANNFLCHLATVYSLKESYLEGGPAVLHSSVGMLFFSDSIITSIKKQLLKIERKVGMEYQKAYKQG